MKAIILAGGGGTRLFPLSRKSMPKQFLSIDQEGSLLEETIRRCQKLMKPEDLLLVTNQRYMHHVQNELESGGMKGAGLVLEPVARNTAPAIALAAKYAMEKLGAGPEEVLFVSTSDHIIKPAEAFRDSVKLAVRQAEKGKFVTFGVHPDYPETGFGYIELGEEQDGVFVTSSFKEKPDRETAEKYLQQGNYEWGRSSLLGSGNGYQMKKLVIRPGGAIRERMHYHRSVHWIVTKGTARVYIDGRPKMVHSNESVYIPQTVPYSIMNPGRIPLVIIQVENGDYLKDDDCVYMEEQHG